MGALKDLYQTIWDELGGDQVFSDMSESSYAEKLRRNTVRSRITKELNSLECLLLLNPQQKGAILFYEDPDDAPLDELELIVKNNVSVNRHIKNVKDCILDLDELSTVDDEEETKKLHKDEMSSAVLNMLRGQAAKVLLLNNSDDNGQANWFIKQPMAFVQATLLANDRKQDAFEDVRFDKDFSTVDLDCHEYLRKTHSPNKWNAIREEDESFNKDAQKLARDIHNWEMSLATAKGQEHEELEQKIAKAEIVLAKATQARKSAITDAFRTGDITEYYYRHRTEQLDKRDFVRVPEMFEVDEFKNKEQYLKDHDLQDLSKEEGEAICRLALKKAKNDRDIHFKKEFLVSKGLAKPGRYLITEMALNKEIFYRGLATGNKIEDEVIENDGKVRRISVDLDEIGEDYIGMTMRQVPSLDELERSVKK
jgi:hypothetical protein